MTLEAAGVDKHLADKALALAAYARQAQDTDMIRWATEIQRRAERKAGELSAQLSMEIPQPLKPPKRHHVHARRLIPISNFTDHNGLRRECHTISQIIAHAHGT